MSRSTLNPTTRRPNAHSEAQLPRAATPSQDLGKVVQRVRASGGHRQQRVADILSLQGAIGNRATVQLLAAQARPGRGDGDGSHIHSAAAAGVQGGGGKLPHLDKLQNLFGGHDLGSVQAYTGPAAAAASRAIGAKAYTVGDKIAFDSPSPSPDIVAHEAAHVVQQRSGVSLKGGVGEVGDSYERQADAVGQAASRGESVERMLGGGSARGRGSEGGAGSAGSGQSVQRYAEKEYDSDKYLVSDGGKLAVHQSGGPDSFYATTEMINESNQKLEAVESFVRLTSSDESFPSSQNAQKANGWANDVPNLSVDNNTKLYRVLPKWQTKNGDLGVHGQDDEPKMKSLDNKNKEILRGNRDKAFSARDNMYMWYDCGKSSAAVMGSPSIARQGRYWKNDAEESTGTHDTPGAMSSEMYKDMMPAFLDSLSNDKRNEINEIINPLNGDYKKAYFKMPDVDREAFDNFVGINRYASPEIGQGYGIAMETGVKGHAPKSNEDEKRYPYHWEGVVAKDGGDTVTLNNASEGDEFEMTNSKWKFSMYGSKKDQTFHDRMLASQIIKGNTATTLLVATTPSDQRDNKYYIDIDSNSPQNVKSDQENASGLAELRKQQSKKELAALTGLNSSKSIKLNISFGPHRFNKIMSASGQSSSLKIESQNSNSSILDASLAPSPPNSDVSKLPPPTLANNNNSSNPLNGQLPNNIAANQASSGRKVLVLSKAAMNNFNDIANDPNELNIQSPSNNASNNKDDQDEWMDASVLDDEEDTVETTPILASPQMAQMMVHARTKSSVRTDNLLLPTREMIEKDLDKRNITNLAMREREIKRLLKVNYTNV